MKTDGFEPLTTEQTAEAFKLLTEVNNKEFNMLKVLEECTELQHLLIKSLSKHEELKPEKDEIIEEMGDLFLRMAVLIEHMDIADEVEDRADRKLALLYEAAKTGRIGSTVTIVKTVKEKV